MTQYRTKRIPPRAEHLLRYVNDILVNNLRAGEDQSVIVLPAIVSRAFLVVNETSTLEVQDFAADTVLVEVQ
jgi:hypothetical protein